jgi:hypothetical protein
MEQAGRIEVGANRNAPPGCSQRGHRRHFDG